ncbi:hypothetical protein CONPUDRAFT_168992 [Coniophora puteana RWD-64-598 SS2]|uniref:Uncharacterized protein n=1 Tax=Coniophora puteana (strain RWD-64-598) TaxID=741705 RepID=A0A5M3MCU9_CONPW|nr:uncharacterized protein CONPUDRAFT_168992 [Coniophora puteana RWD-64-598 SS2]EIW76455.1 hypothetical protein CONPUDRAFT_168992 [Coniophora puteana RWD-64-598 SS2]
MVYAQGAPGFGVQERNPFDDPSSSQVNLPHAGAHDKSPSETIKVPEGFDPRSPHDERQLDDHQADPVPVPLPAASEVMLSRHSRELPEGYDVFGAGPTQDYFDQGPKPTNERLPLLGNRTYTPGRDLHRAPSIDSQIASWKPKSANGHGHGDAPSTANGNGNGNGHAHESSETANDDGDLAATKRPLSHAHYPGYGAGGYGAVSFPFAARGWAEHVLPHGARYFVHPGVRAVADADLRRLVELDVVSGVVGRAGIVPDGCEMWIREVYPANKNGGKKKGAQKKGWFNGSGKGKGRSEDVEVAWVDHRARRVSRDVPSVAERAGEEDRLDDEYRYWSFVESHPSHVHPRPDLRQEALDALRWSYTDQLLAYPQPVPSPFSTDECMQLERLLSANGLVPERNAVQTRLIARILLRVVHWRQQHFRPQKPLPEDVPQAQAQAQLAARRRPSVFRTILDILIGIACLGIPFMFENKAQPGSAFDIEGGALPHHAGSMFVAGGVACLVAAIILSASVTLVTLPGIDEIARIAGIVAIACSVASMISAFAVIFRHKAEVYHGRSHGVGGANGIGGEGFIVLSRRSVLLSLPLAFLAYSVAGFVTGILVYSFKSAPGAVVSLPVIPEAMSMVSQSLPTTADVKVESWSRWTALGALGGLSVAVLATAYAARK